MRCNNCGWDNAPGNGRCEKCNAPLDGSIVAGGLPSVEPKSDSNLTGTIKGAEPNAPYLDQEQTVRMKKVHSSPNAGVNEMNTGLNNCPNCQAPVRIGVAVCPYCSHQLQPSSENMGSKVTNSGVRTAEVETSEKESSRKSNIGTGTIRPNWGKTKNNFHLIPISEDGKEEESIAFNEDSVTLNRDNLDPGNKTITSKEQARIELVEGKWCIVNRSELKTTYVRIENEEPVELKDGTTLLIGDKEFIFKTV